MVGHCDHMNALSEEERLEHSRLADGFDRKWRATEVPAFEEVLGERLPDSEPLLTAVIIDLAAADLEYRIDAKLAFDVQQYYLARYPQVASCNACLLDLFHAEFKARRKKDKRFTTRMYLRSVPDVYRNDLRLRLRPFANYTLMSELGRGGMGLVHLAHQRGAERPVALKVILGGEHASPKDLQFFRREARAAARLVHDNIVRIYEIGTTGRKPFFSMEYVDGGSLAEVLKAGDNKPWRAEEAVQLIATLAAAIDHAHSRGIVHRDLKPANVLLTRGEKPKPKISDFGLAKLLDPGGQVSGGTVSAILGTPEYMAPEQAESGSQVGPPADVYALGAILYHLLTGGPPFRAKTPLETLAQVRTQDPIPPSRRQPGVPRDLETICLKCLEKSPESRYETALELHEDLIRFRDHIPIRARRALPWERVGKWAHRHPPWALLILVAVALAATAGLYGINAARNRDLENQRLTVRVDELRDQASKARSEEELAAARENLINVRTAVQGRSELRQHLQPRVDAGLSDVTRRLGELQHQKQRRSQAQADRETLQAFYKKLHDALFYETQFTARGSAENSLGARESAREAIDLYRASDSAGFYSMTTLPESLKPDEQAEIKEALYTLLLVLARLEPTPRGGLLRLHEAAHLRWPSTRAFHVRGSDCLAKAGGQLLADRRSPQSIFAGQLVLAAARGWRWAAGAIPLHTALDHFLIGQELYKRGDLSAAREQFEAALQIQPNHFWAQCLSAICSLRQGHPEAAWPGLTACLATHPEYAWLYVWRGFASQAAGLARGRSDALTIKPSTLPDRTATGRPLNASASKVASRPTAARTEYEKAETDYQQALDLLESQPNDDLRYVVLVNRGLLRLQFDETNNAKADLRSAIKLAETMRGARRVEAHAALAELLRREGQLDEALGWYDKAIELRPDWAPLSRASADVNLRREGKLDEAQWKRAMRDLNQAIKYEAQKNPVLAQDHTNRGRLLVLRARSRDPLCEKSGVREDLEAALAAAKAALQCDAHYAWAHQLKIELLVELRHYVEAISSCDALLASGFKPAARYYELRGKVRAKLCAIAQGCDLHLLSSAEASSCVPMAGKNLLVVAAAGGELQFRLFDEDGKQIVDVTSSAAADNDSRVLALRDRLNSLWSPHQLTTIEKHGIVAAVTSILGFTLNDAIEDLTRALVTQPRSASLWSSRGKLYVQTDAPKLALEDCEKAIRLDSSDSGAYVGRGFALVLLGQHEKGVSDAEEALQKGGVTPELLFNAAQIYARATFSARHEDKPRWPKIAVIQSYQNRAVDLIKQLRDRLPEDDRSRWRKMIKDDKFLKTLFPRDPFPE
jgi:eukaryotic-like serine/threonine-protein kinase